MENGPWPGFVRCPRFPPCAPSEPLSVSFFCFQFCSSFLNHFVVVVVDVVFWPLLLLLQLLVLILLLLLLLVDAAVAAITIACNDNADAAVAYDDDK